jgi:L-threonylcarbamoyladenylate synthase
LIIINGETNKVVEYINNKAQQATEKVGIMSTDETKNLYNAKHVISIGSRKNPGKIAANLFDSLREFDKIDVGLIYSEGFSEEGLEMAIMNRLKKAAGYKIIEV